MIFSKRLLSYLLMIALISFLGFLTENIWLALTKGYVDNRNMIFPFLIGYGLAVMILFIFFGTPAEPRFFKKKLLFTSSILKTIYYFFVIALCICVGEMLLGIFVEKTCHIQWWNYSGLPLHIGKYTSIPTSLGFSLLITLFMRYCFIPTLHGFAKLNYHTLAFCALSVMGVMICDFLHSAYHMYKNKKLLQYWKITTANTRMYKLIHSQEG